MSSFYFGAMSKNVIDTVIEYANLHPSQKITFIPSRRQIDVYKGYCMNWTTSEFVLYVKTHKKYDNIDIERDHGGPGQGTYEDDGFSSLECDASLLDVIHIDPWKKYPSMKEGLDWTIKMIRFCYEINPILKYEIATEEAIRPFTIEELEEFILRLKNSLEEPIFKQIQYLVVQCGTLLMEGQNLGVFDSNRLIELLDLCKKYDLTAKEHNGDWVDLDVFKQKNKLGLSCFNVAPELAYLETSVILEIIKTDEEDYAKIYQLCLDSGKWKKWISTDFDWSDKDKLIMITCHYLYSNEEYQKILSKSKYENIQSKIREKIWKKITDLYSCFDKIEEKNHYYIREKCIFCEQNDFEFVFETDYSSSLSLGLHDEKQDGKFMPYNVLICNHCHTAQNKYLGALDIVYHKNHNDNFGSTKNKKHLLFSEFICENTNLKGIIEVGACHDTLATYILKNNLEIEYTIIDPSFTSENANVKVIPEFFENVHILNGNTLIMSDVFEHFYEPLEILKKIQNNKNIQYIYLNHPDFDYSIKNNILINLNCEHTFLIEHSFLFSIFENYGFQLKRRFDFEKASLFLEFERNFSSYTINKTIQNKNTKHDVKDYFSKLINIVSNINLYMEMNQNTKIYLWPASVHSITLLTLGLEYKFLSAILDNSPNKIGKYLYGYNLLCLSFNDILKNIGENDIIFLGGGGNYTKELNHLNNKNIFYLENFLS